MHALPIRSGAALRILCIGAHSDDIEIGCGATLFELMASGAPLSVDWCVLSASGARGREARASADALLQGAKEVHLDIKEFPDGRFPYHGSTIKDWFETLKGRPRPDIIFTHARHDLHQDHREVGSLTWNTFRDHMILEYEIPKWDGDLGTPNVYVPVSAESLGRKTAHLEAHFASQRSEAWFDAETFRGLARLRGVECHAPSRFAEAFYARKLTLGLA